MRVAASRSRSGASFALLASLLDVRYELALSVALYTEWQDVLTRQEHVSPGLDAQTEHKLFALPCFYRAPARSFFLWRPFLRDPDDDMVLECAVASASHYIVTHNVRDFGRSDVLGIQALTPAAFLNLMRTSP